MQRLKFLSAVVILATFSAVAQAPAATAKAADTIPTAATKQIPNIDEVSSLKVQNALKNMQLSRMEQSIAAKNLQTAQEDLQKLVMSIEAAYPGFTINLQTVSLIEKPKAPVAPVVPEVKK